MNINFTAIILILISGGALLLSIRALYQLYKMDLLGKNFWIESGLKNIFLYIIWIMILVSSIRLFLEKPEAIYQVKLSLGIFWIAVLLLWIQHMVAGIKILFFKAPNNFPDLLEKAPFTKEVFEKTSEKINQLDITDSSEKDFFTELVEDSEDDFDEMFRQETTKMIVGKTFGFVAVSALLYLSVICL